MVRLFTAALFLDLCLLLLWVSQGLDECQECVAGRVAVRWSGCPSSGGGRLELDVCGGVSDDVAPSSPTCHFVPVEHLGLDFGDKGDGQGQEQQQVEEERKRFLAAVATASAVEAVATREGVRWGESSACGVAVNATAAPPLSCEVPVGNESLAVTVVWGRAAEGGGGSSNASSTLWAAMPSALPSLPHNTISSVTAAGNTFASRVMIILSGSDLRAPLACELPDGVVFPATVLNHTNAVCVIPPPAPAVLRIHGAPDCTPLNVTMEPPRLMRLGVVDVHPKRAKHVGSTELSVSLAPEALAWVLSSPLDVDRMLFCRLVGAVNAGEGDLLMPGQLLRSEVPAKVGCSTPLSPQLPRVSFPLEVGLGHTLFAPVVVNHSAAAGEYMDQGVETGEGRVLFSGPGLPVVSLVERVSLVPANDSLVHVNVELAGESGVLVTARLELRSDGDGPPLRLFPEGPIIESEVVWAPGSSGGQVVTLMLPFSNAGQQIAGRATGAGVVDDRMHVVLCNVTNAETGGSGATALQLESELPEFGVLSPSRVVYARELRSDPRSGLAAVTFAVGPVRGEEVVVVGEGVRVGVEVVAATPEWAPLLHLPRNTLWWETCGGRMPACRPKNVTVNIQTHPIDEKVYLRAMLRLSIISGGARVAEEGGDGALLHVIGSRDGVCPAGSRSTTTAGGVSPWDWEAEEHNTSSSSSSTHHLPLITDISISINSTTAATATTTGGWSLPLHYPQQHLSPDFRPEVTEYGAHVGEGVESITLDVQTAAARAGIQLEAVYRSAHVVLEPSVLGNLLMAGANVSGATALLLQAQEGTAQQEVWNLTAAPVAEANGPHRRRSLRGDTDGGKFSRGGGECEGSALCEVLEKKSGYVRGDGGEVGVARVVRQPQEMKGGKLRWRLPVTVGRNIFRIVMSSEGEGGGGGDAGGGMEGVQGGGGGGNVSTPSWAASFPYTLSVTRLADPSHVGLASVRVVSVGLNTLLCRSTDEREEEEDDEEERKAWQAISEAFDMGESRGHPPACSPDEPMSLTLLNGSADHFVQVSLAHGDVQGIRVEIGSKVLDSSATAPALTFNMGTNDGDNHSATTTTSLPLVRLPPTPEPHTVIPILVVAEDGVTSATFTLRLLHPSVVESPPPSPTPSSRPRSAGQPLPRPLPLPTNTTTEDERKDNKNSSSSSSSSGGAAVVVPASQFLGLPAAVLPASVAESGACEGCARGYFSSRAGAGRCGLCSPGSFAPAVSGRCYPCGPGRFSPSWGARECWQCAKGTFTPWPAARACLLCPPNMTTPAAGASNCSTPLDPTDLSRDFAVIVTLRVAFLVDPADLDDVSLRTGLIGSTEAVVAHLMRLDTASVFRVPLGDVAIGLSILNAATQGTAVRWALQPANNNTSNINSTSATPTATTTTAVGGGGTGNSPSANLTQAADGSTALAVDLGLVTELPEEVMSLLGLPTNGSGGGDGGNGRRRLLAANVTATLAADVDLRDDSTDDIKAKLSVQELSADNGIELLAKSPDTFFSRTTKALNARPMVAAETVHMKIHDPRHRGWFGLPIWAWVSVVGSGIALLVLGGAVFNRRLRNLWATRWRRMPALFSSQHSSSSPSSHPPSSAEMVPTSLASRLRLTRLRSGLGGAGAEGLGLVAQVPSSSSPEWTVVELKER